jgi:hypothetical protein
MSATVFNFEAKPRGDRVRGVRKATSGVLNPHFFTVQATLNSQAGSGSLAEHGQAQVSVRLPPKASPRTPASASGGPSDLPP